MPGGKEFKGSDQLVARIGFAQAAKTREDFVHFKRKVVHEIERKFAICLYFIKHLLPWDKVEFAVSKCCVKPPGGNLLP